MSMKPRLPAADVRRFENVLSEIDVLGWADEYAARDTCDGTSWSMRLTWGEWVKETGGANAYPQRFEGLLRAVSDLAGGFHIR
jgi:hypothetical protein